MDKKHLKKIKRAKKKKKDKKEAADQQQRIANQHGGLIQVQSVPGDTCFTLLLPMEP